MLENINRKACKNGRLDHFDRLFSFFILFKNCGSLFIFYDRAFCSAYQLSSANLVCSPVLQKQITLEDLPLFKAIRPDVSDLDLDFVSFLEGCSGDRTGLAWHVRGHPRVHTQPLLHLSSSCIKLFEIKFSLQLSVKLNSALSSDRHHICTILLPFWLRKLPFFARACSM